MTCRSKNIQVLFSFPYNIIFFPCNIIFVVEIMQRTSVLNWQGWRKRWCGMIKAMRWRGSNQLSGRFYILPCHNKRFHNSQILERYETEIEWKMKMKAEIRNEHHHLLEVSKGLTHSLKFAINTQQFPLCCSSILKRLNLINHISSNGRRDYLVGFLA